ncbi:MAG: DUF4173 domain-containing protein [Bacteroidota bacterium]
MTRLQSYRLPLALAMTAIYNLFFWQEQLGINLPIFSLLIIALMFLLNPAAIRSRNAWITALGSIITGVLVVCYHSGTSQVVHILSTLLFVGFAHQAPLRTVFHALGQLFESSMHMGLSLQEEWLRIRKEQPGFSRVSNYLKLIVIPIVGVLVFFFIFRGANPRFAALTDDLFVWIGEWFADFSFLRFFFLLFGFIISVGIIYSRTSSKILEHDAAQNDELKRERRKNRLPFNFIGLKKEYRIGVLMIGMVNLMLLANNVIDIDWIWLGFEVEPNMNLKNFVHEGTYLLILSIMLSMGIMLYFFRRNQHFYRDQGLLHILSYLWVAQNVILVISVALRNYHYIAYHGLAYKRIGVFFFLLATVLGLFTLFAKIRNQKSAFYLFRINGWAVYGTILLLCCFNWDMIIARYNLTQDYPGQIDTEFLLSLSDKTLPVLIDHHEEAKAKLNSLSDDGYDATQIESMITRYELHISKKIDEFQETQEKYSWPSWNLPEANTLSYLHAYQGTLKPFENE